MSKTPETDANTWSDSSEGVLFKVVSVEFARRLERERDEARNKMADALQEVDLRTLDFERMKQERDIAEDERIDMAQQLESEKECHASCQNERDEALSQIVQAECRAERFCQERDEAREKIERQADIGCSFQKTNPAMCGRYKQERDESQEKYATEATEHMLAVNKLCNERDEAREEIKRLKVILDLIKKDVS
jgi:hypothetical protein